VTRLDRVVPCSGGLLVAPRGATGPAVPALRVGSVGTVRPPPSAPVEVRRNDDHVWRRHWLDGDRLVIDFVDVAFVEVDRDTVTFDRSLAPEMEEHLLLDHVLPLVLARDGQLVVHGGVIGRGGQGAVLVGATGAGKSTLTAFAWQRGWTVGGDDGAVLFTTDPPTAEPTYATLRLTPATTDLLGIDPAVCSEVVGKVRVHGHGREAFHQGPVELRAIAIIEPVAAGEARFEPLAGADAHARLFGSTFHAELSRNDRLPATLEGLAAIVETTTVGLLLVPRGLDGLASAELLLRALVAPDAHQGMKT
jgi:hypothetical protein